MNSKEILQAILDEYSSMYDTSDFIGILEDLVIDYSEELISFIKDTAEMEGGSYEGKNS